MAYEDWEGRIEVDDMPYPAGLNTSAWKSDFLPEPVSTGVRDCSELPEFFGRSNFALTQHIVLGAGNVRFCCLKNNPTLWVRTMAYISEINIPENEDDDPEFEEEGAIEHSGATWEWSYKQHGDRKIVLTLIEPDGTTWKGHCGPKKEPEPRVSRITPIPAPPFIPPEEDVLYETAADPIITDGVELEYGGRWQS